MDFRTFFHKCQNENTVSDFESYLSYCILEKKIGKKTCSTEEYTRLRDLAFDRRDEKAARAIYELASASSWQEGEWEGALK